MKKLANVSLQVVPLVKVEDLYPVVDKVIDYIKSTGVKYEVGPMETTMEGDLRELLEIVALAQEICIEAGADRVASMVKIDYAPKDVTINEKVQKYRQ